MIKQEFEEVSIEEVEAYVKFKHGSCSLYKWPFKIAKKQYFGVWVLDSENRPLSGCVGMQKALTMVRALNSYYAPKKK